jgi:RNA polymerase sigma-70 factor (ECF subfamily)
MTESTILQRAITGDRDARAALVAEYYPSCLRVAQRMLGERADAEDAVQDAFLRAFRALPRFNPEVPFRAWLFRILINHCHSYAKHRGRWQGRIVSAPEVLDQSPGHSPADAGVSDLHHITAAVDALDPLMREAFVLKYVEELEYTEMALITGASISALKMRVKRACDTLRPRLEGIFP